MGGLQGWMKVGLFRGSGARYRFTTGKFWTGRALNENRMKRNRVKRTVNLKWELLLCCFSLIGISFAL